MIEVAVQYATDEPESPTPAAINAWVKEALAGLRDDAEMVIRIVDAGESARLNAEYRDKPGPTNVLSFAAELPDEVDLPELGDVVICATVVREEALEQGKPIEAHWAHMVVHGLLHLLGHDHEQPAEAESMEKLEAEILGRLGYPDPYA